MERVCERKKDHFSSLYKKRGSDTRVSEARAEELLQLGFLSGADLWYDFERFGIDAYVNDRSYKAIHPINGKFSTLISDKRYLAIFFAGRPDLLPDLNVAIENGRIRFARQCGQFVENTQDTRGMIAEFVERHGKLIAKPVNLSGGRKIFFISSTNIKRTTTLVSESDALVLNSVMENEQYAKDINPTSLNTYRVIFFKRPNGQNRLFRVIHRFGPVNSKIDNVSAGGCAADVDIETGVMSRVLAPDQTPLFRENHPGTGAPITGVTIPDWEKKRGELQQIIDHLFFVDFAGVDVAPTPQGLKVVEINSSPGMRLQQFNKPGFLDEEFKEFLYSKGYHPSK